MRERAWLVGIVVVVGLVWAGAALVGCAATGAAPSKRQIPKGAGITGADPLALREDLSDFGDYYSAMVAGTCSQVAADTKDRKIRELALLFKIRSIPRMRAILIGPDPREALIRAWIVVDQGAYQFTHGSMKDVFGAQQQTIRDTIQQLNDAIVQLAYRHFPAAAVESTKQEIDEYAAATPLGADLTGNDDLQRLEARKEGPLSLLLVPLKPLSGVSDTAESIAQLAVVAQSATQVAKEMPQMIRWQTEMLLLELDDMDTTTTLRNELGRVADEFGQVADAADQLPGRVRTELEGFLTESQKSNEQLAATLREAKEVTAGLNDAMTSATKVSESVRTTASEASTTAQAWRETADAATRTVEAIKQLQGEGVGGAGGKEMSLEEVTAVAEQIRTAVESARQLLTELREPIPADNGLQKMIDDAVDRTGNRMTGVLNGFLWRGIVLIAVGFCAVLALRFVPKRAPV